MPTLYRAEEIRSRYRALRNVSTEEIVAAAELAERRARWALGVLAAVVGSAIVFGILR